MQDSLDVETCRATWMAENWDAAVMGKTLDTLAPQMIVAANSGLRSNQVVAHWEQIDLALKWEAVNAFVHVVVVAWPADETGIELNWTCVAADWAVRVVGESLVCWMKTAMRVFFVVAVVVAAAAVVGGCIDDTLPWTKKPMAFAPDCFLTLVLRRKSNFHLMTFVMDSRNAVVADLDWHQDNPSAAAAAESLLLLTRSES
jgi:hypothetical protein